MTTVRQVDATTTHRKSLASADNRPEIPSRGAFAIQNKMLEAAPLTGIPASLGFE